MQQSNSDDTPLAGCEAKWLRVARVRFKSAVDASLCRRTPKFAPHNGIA
jgi:hypothetical protein